MTWIRVVPLSDLTAPIAEGYDPGPALKQFDGFREAAAGTDPGQQDADPARRPGALPSRPRPRTDSSFGPTGPVAITRTNIGENVEGTVAGCGHRWTVTSTEGCTTSATTSSPAAPNPTTRASPSA